MHCASQWHTGSILPNTPVSAAAGKKVLTIEGLSVDASHPVQVAWKELNVPQSGCCQSGQIMCGTYTRIRTAIKQASGQAEEEQA